MKFVRMYTGEDQESHFEELPLTSQAGERIAAATSDAAAVSFGERTAGTFWDFHPGPERQYVFYLSCTVEVGVGDGTAMRMEPGDVMLAQDATGRGHTSRVLQTGMCAFVHLNP